MEKHRAFSVLGNIAIVNFSKGVSIRKKKEFAKFILERNKSITTVLEKVGKFKGRLRKQETKFLAGEKTKEVLYKENGCEFRFNIDETYFSPRLSNERKEIASEIKKGDEVLVMCAGVAPYPIVIAKNSAAKKVWSNELNRKANLYAKQNISRNKLENKIELVPGDIKRVAPKLDKKFDVIVMARPQLSDPFLEEAFMLSRKKTRIYYYGFCAVDEVEAMVEMVKSQADKFNKKIKILNVKHAGEIAPYKVRVRIDFVVKN